MILNIDHFVITVASLEDTCQFYERVLGFERVDAPGKPTALRFSSHKINVHEVGHTFEPKAAHPTPGSADFCLITDLRPEETILHLGLCGVPVELGL